VAGFGGQALAVPLVELRLQLGPGLLHQLLDVLDGRFFVPQAAAARRVGGFFALHAGHGGSFFGRAHAVRRIAAAVVPVPAAVPAAAPVVVPEQAFVGECPLPPQRLDGLLQVADGGSARHHLRRPNKRQQLTTKHQANKLTKQTKF
jgi:hypothetical protein